MYIPNLFESISTLSTGVSKLVIIPCLNDKHVGALFFSIEFVRHVQYSGFGIYLEFSLKEKTVNNGSKSVVLQCVSKQIEMIKIIQLPEKTCDPTNR